MTRRCEAPRLMYPLSGAQRRWKAASGDQVRHLKQCSTVCRSVGFTPGSIGSTKSICARQVDYPAFVVEPGVLAAFEVTILGLLVCIGKCFVRLRYAADTHGFAQDLFDP